MPEMVVRVSLAIANAKRAKHDLPACRWEHLTDEAHSEYELYAHAAIEAMREPTEEMVDAGSSQSQRGGFEPDQTWKLMIEESLK